MVPSTLKFYLACHGIDTLTIFIIKTTASEVWQSVQSIDVKQPALTDVWSCQHTKFARASVIKLSSLRKILRWSREDDIR